MILHITFHSGANPHIHYSHRETLLRDWKRWKKNPDAIPEFLICSCSARVLRNITSTGETWWYLDTGKHLIYYKRLGMALRALERLHMEAMRKEGRSL